MDIFIESIDMHVDPNNGEFVLSSDMGQNIDTVKTNTLMDE